MTTIIVTIPAGDWMSANGRLSNRDAPTKTWDNRSGPRGATNTTRSLTHSLEQARRG